MKKTSVSAINRREFLKRVAKTSLIGSGAYASLSSLTMMDAMAGSAQKDYKALVCVFLLGGNDSYNMFIPRAASAYQEYKTSRTNLAISQSDILAVNSANMGDDFGFHPSMPEMQSLFNQSDCAVVANVGTLIAPTTRETYLNRSVLRPPKLFSHNDQQDYWQSMVDKKDSGAIKGWAGRMADMLYHTNRDPLLPMNISMSGSNLWQVGDNGLPYNLSASGIDYFFGMNRGWNVSHEQARVATFEKLLQAEKNNMFVEQYASKAQRAYDLAHDLRGKIGKAPELTTPFPETSLGNDLKKIAEVLSVKDSLNTSRQIFFVGMGGGWDTHDNQRNTHSQLLGELSQGLQAFNSATKELGLSDSVTTFTGSDFGRTLGSNGDGSDHGWGSHQIVMGGAVKGSTVYGSVPPLVIGGPQDAGRGRIIPTISTEQYAATIARWYGLSASQIAELFPNLGNFDQADLGFMV